MLHGLGLLGCTPSAIFTHGTDGSCVEEQNAIAYIFDFKLKSLVDHFNNKFSADSKFIFINSTSESDSQNSNGNNCLVYLNFNSYTIIKINFTVFDFRFSGCKCSLLQNKVDWRVYS